MRIIIKYMYSFIILIVYIINFILIILVNGLFISLDNFTDQPKVINGCSDLLVEVFGDRGKHTRVALGMNSLPMNIAVEIDLILEVENN